jgi:transcriptional regulator with XRE-family HTH domain
MHTEQQGMGGSREARDRHTHLAIEHRRLTLIEPVFQAVSDRSARARTQSTEAGFGNRLRLERERRRITLASIAADTKISLALLQGLERDDVSRWPSGIFRRSFIRGYAQAVGLDADVIEREFFEYFRDPVEAPRPGSTDSAPARARRASGDPALRLTLAAPDRALTHGRFPAGMWRRWVAVACDVSVLMVIGLTCFIVLKQFWMPLAMATLIYYVAGIVLLGNTPGVSLAAPGTRHNAVQSGGRTGPQPAQPSSSHS